MALPRETILQAIKTRLEGITIANGFQFDVTTVRIGFELPAKRHRSDYPLFLIGPQPDVDERETQGAGTANRYHRRWPIGIRAAMWPKSSQDVRAEGERLITDLVKRLTSDERFGLQPIFGLGFVLDRILDPDDFEADQSGLTYVGVDITVRYDFRPDSI